MTSKLTIEDFDDPTFNPFIVSEIVAGQGAVTDIYPELRRLRHENPVQQMDPRAYFGTMPDQGLTEVRKWTVLGQPLVNQVLMDAGTYTNQAYKHTLAKMFGRSITTMDPPEHRSFRMLFQKGFTPTMIGHYKDHFVPDIVNGLIDKFEGRGEAELIKEFTLHFPFVFVMELLHLPEELRPVFHKIAFAQTAIRYDVEHATEAGRKLTDFAVKLIADRRRQSLKDTDFIGSLINAEIDGEQIPDDVLIGFIRQLMNAAGDTSYHGSSNLLALLLRHPEQLEAIRQDRSLIPQAIEEGLRNEPPIVYIERTPSRQVTLAGCTIEPGDHMFISLGDANHDESVYPDADRFDIFRGKQKQYAFGQGAHVCIGQHLARLEIEVAVNALLDRLPNLRLNPDHPEPVVTGVSMRKPKEIKVLFDT